MFIYLVLVILSSFLEKLVGKVLQIQALFLVEGLFKILGLLFLELDLLVEEGHDLLGAYFAALVLLFEAVGLHL